MTERETNVWDVVKTYVIATAVVSTVIVVAGAVVKIVVQTK